MDGTVELETPLNGEIEAKAEEKKEPLDREAFI